MPELPEVEVVRRGLETYALDQKIRQVDVLHPRPVRDHLAGPADFAARLRGRQIKGARRRGKFLWLPLDSDDAVLAHLGMSGQFLIRDVGTPDETHLRVRMRLGNGGNMHNDRELRYVDQRMFGGLSLTEVGGGLPAQLHHIAPDPIDPEFDAAGFVEAVRGRTTNIKRALLDQRLISGVGNIYADEALWRARLHYARPTRTLRRAEVEALLAGVRAVLQEALAVGGTSFDALYVDINGNGGYFARELAVYGREGEPCPRCGTPVRRDKFMNRSSYTCPTCQPRPWRPHW